MPASYSVVPSVATGDWITAGWVNTYIGGNMTAMWVGLAAGDMEYYNSATTKARLPIGANGSYYESNGSAPGWTKFYRPGAWLLNKDVALVAGDDAHRFRIPFVMNGWNLYSVAAARKSGTGIMNIQIRNVNTGFNMLSTALTLDSGETDSSTAATPAVIDTAHDDVSTGQQIAIDVDGAGTNTLMAQVEAVFAKP